MRRWLASLLLISCTALADDTPRIDQDALLKRIEQKDSSLVILDVRTPEEFAEGHVPGAVNVPYTHLPARAAEVAANGDKEIVLYCRSGVRAERAAARLREHGFTKLLHLDGDMQQWVDKQRPIQK